MSRVRPSVLLLAMWLTAHTDVQNRAEGQDLSSIPVDVLTPDQRSLAQQMLERDIERRTRDFNDRHRAAWDSIRTRDQWEPYRDERIARLRASLFHEWPEPGPLHVKVTGSVRGEGFVIQNLIYESHPGVWVTGNLYLPATLGESMPGILIAHAHHNGKRHTELQDMGMLWAQAGCMVLIIDQFGYGERRTHPFHTDEDYGRPWKPARQDYYFRYDTGIQLQLSGDSLMGWMVRDLMRGVDLLLSREGIDAGRIAILGAVAGGGDPAGITAALDPRIACCVPFNFGGPQPETPYPLPENAETDFNYLVFTYWDSTRGLRLGGSGDFPHWVITASLAPRFLIHSHEFAWDGQRDPVWQRYQKVWGEFYQAADRVGVAHGRGVLRMQAPDASHCTHIGEYHRRMIHPLFEKWLGIRAMEYSRPRATEELVCLTEAARKELPPTSPLDAISDLGKTRVTAFRQTLAGQPPEDQRKTLRAAWSRVLGPIDPDHQAVVQSRTVRQVPGLQAEQLVLETEPGILVPALVLMPGGDAAPTAIAIGLAQSGKAGFLKERSTDIRSLLEANVAVVLVDVRGTGETQSGTSQGRGSSRTDHSVHMQLFGETILGQQLRDLRSVMASLRTRSEFRSRPFVLWGESFAPTNSRQTDFRVPHGVDEWPLMAEPVGGLLSLLGALCEEDVRAVFVSGGLTSLHSVLDHFAVLIPHDACVPGALTAGDLCDLTTALAPRPVHLQNMVDHLNRPVGAEELRRVYQVVPGGDPPPQSHQRLSFGDQPTSAAAWILQQL